MKLRNLIFVCSLFFVANLEIKAQVPPPPPPPIADDGGVIKIDSRLIMVPVSVIDSKGQPVTGLTAKDFRIKELNQMQEIAEVSDAEKVPLEIALLFDVSASTDTMFKFEQETAAKFLQDVMRSEDRATIFTVGEQPLIIKARDTAANAAVAIKTITPTKQFTAFYDTVRAAAEHLQNNTPEGRRKVIVVISDGEDTNSVGIRRGFSDLYATLGKNINTLTTGMLETKRNEIKGREQSKVLKSLQNADTVFYSINPAGSSYKLNKISVFGQSNLEKFAGQTGGTAFLPKFLPIDLKSNYENTANTRKNTELLEAIFRQLTSELRAQYLVQYYSEAEYPNGKYIDLEVGLQNPRDYKIRARQGYFVKN